MVIAVRTDPEISHRLIKIFKSHDRENGSKKKSTLSPITLSDLIRRQNAQNFNFFQISSEKREGLIVEMPLNLNYFESPYFVLRSAKNCNLMIL